CWTATGGKRTHPPGRLVSIRLHLELRPVLFLCSTLQPVSSSRPAVWDRPRVEPRSRLAVATEGRQGALFPGHALTAASTGPGLAGPGGRSGGPPRHKRAGHPGRGERG